VGASLTRPFARVVPATVLVDMVTQASKSKLSFDWDTRGAPTIAHLARIDGKYFVVQFFKTGPRAGQLATAFIPNNAQLGAMLRAAGVGG
jgi:hypothetical protein